MKKYYSISEFAKLTGLSIGLVSFIHYIISKIYGKRRYKKSDIEKKVKEWIE